jgi:ABC-type sugar transport system permease subunit
MAESAVINTRPLRSRNTNWYVLVAAVLLTSYYILISAWPFLYNLFISFWKVNLSSPTGIYERFVGTAYYELVFTDPVFIRSFLNTLIYLAVFVVVGLLISLILAGLIHRTHGVMKKIYIAMYFAPVITSQAATALVWKLIYYPKVGILATFLTSVIGLQPQTFLQDPRIALFCIIVLDMWKSIGLETVILLTGIEEIPENLFEASVMDGASSFQQFRQITIPLLRPQIFFLFVIKSIYVFKVFIPVYMMTSYPQGGPMHSTQVLALNLYQQSFQNLKFSYGAVVSLVIFVLMLFFVTMQIRYYRSEAY